MRTQFSFFILLVIASSAATPVLASAVDTLQQEYKANGAGPFNAETGKTRWTEMHVSKKTGKQINCQSCHGKNLTQPGKHNKTGKVIDPLAPSVNPERLTDIKFINKWFKRNCKQVLGRKCADQEKGDFLEYLKNQ